MLLSGYKAIKLLYFPYHHLYHSSGHLLVSDWMLIETLEAVNTLMSFSTQGRINDIRVLVPK